jgi:integrase
MPKPRAAKLETPTARARLAPRKKPYFVGVAPGIHLGYRKNEGAGTWSVRVAADGAEWLKKIGLADDLEPAAPPVVLNYWQALEVARRLGRRQPGDPADDDNRPVTVNEAIDRYEAHLLRNGGDPYNAGRARLHLTAALAGKPVALLDRNELERWRDGLLEKGLSRASVNRTRSTLRAALELAARKDRRIRNVVEFKAGLPGLTGLPKARNVVLDDDTVRRFVAAAHAHERNFGLLVAVLAETGARPGQAARLLVKHLADDDPVAPVLKMPKSGKGGATDRAARKAITYSVPITPALAATLKQETVGRQPDDFLLTRANGEPWSKTGERLVESPAAYYRDAVIAVVQAIGRDPDEVTLYALRHSSITRALKANVPIRIVAASHDTSVVQVERVYSDQITAHSDDIERRALLSTEAPRSDKIVALTPRRPS